MSPDQKAQLKKERATFWEKRTQEIIDGLVILNAYPACSVRAEHDEIFAGPDDDGVVSQEDQDKLKALSWRKASEGGWMIFT